MGLRVFPKPRRPAAGTFGSWAKNLEKSGVAISWSTSAFFMFPALIPGAIEEEERKNRGR